MVPLSSLADVRACVEASGAPFPSRGFSPGLEAPHMYLVHAGGLALRKDTKGLVATASAALANLVGWESSAKFGSLINVSWFFSQG